jgi:hypothetical protein
VPKIKQSGEKVNRIKVFYEKPVPDLVTKDVNIAAERSYKPELRIRM